MKKLCFLILLIGSWNQLPAQDQIENLLLEIEQNNTVLAAFIQQAEADKIGNRTGIYLENPEVEVHYLWGNKEGETQTEFSIVQPFDFPTVYYHKQKLADEKNKQEDLKFRIKRAEILLEAKQICIELIYLKELSDKMEEQLKQGEQCVSAYRKKLDQGEISILDYNKAELNWLNNRQRMDELQLDRERLQSDLIRLNGGKPVDYTSPEYPLVSLSPDFDRWFEEIHENNRILCSLQQEIKISKMNEKVQRSSNLPSFSLGYMSEKGLEEHFQGPVLSISVPLWQNKNTVKQIKSQTRAFQAAKEDASIRFYNEVKYKYQQALQLKKMAETYGETFQTVDNAAFLKKALDKGEISLTNYLIELSVYYESIENFLKIKRNFHLVVSELQQWEDSGFN